MNFINQPNEDIHCEYQDLHEKQIENLKKIKTLQQKEYRAIRNLCYEYRNIFYVKDTALTFTNQTKHKVKTSDESLIFTNTYRYPVHKTVNRQINETLKNGIIQNSNSPWSSPIWIVLKNPL